MLTVLAYSLAWLGVAILGYDLLAKPLAWLGEQAGWAFYRRHMRAAERKMIWRELLRTQLGTAAVRYQQAQIEMTASLHQHAHTMAGLTGQPYLVSRDHVMPLNAPGFPVPLYVPEMIIPLAWLPRPVMLPDDPRHQPWTLPPA